MVMRSLRILAACALFAACGGHAQPATTPAAGDAMDAARRAVESWRQAWEADSYDQIAPLYAHDRNLVLVSQGVAFTGWDKVDAHLKEVLGHAREVHMKLADVTVDAIDDDCAIVVTQMDRDVSDGQVTTSERGVLTLVLHRDANGWLVVSEHYSYPQQS
jgi:uncharacterized protein (TIGR02246 family)